ncbi:MAG: 2-phospho-L-lactate guanylyltransferase [Candidatus Promineifilaceae bacterium]
MNQTSVWAVIPVKQLTRTKSRLSGILRLSERAEITLRLLNRQLQLLDRCHLITNILVVSQDERVQALVSSWDCDVLEEQSPSDLNKAVAEGYQAVDDAATHCLILPSDLPLFSAESLTQLLAPLPAAAICPDKHGRGTNALLLPTGTPFRFRFGLDSFQHHQRSFQQLNLPFQTLDLPEIAFDLDTPADWSFWQKALPSFSTI